MRWQRVQKKGTEIRPVVAKTKWRWCVCAYVKAQAILRRLFLVGVIKLLTMANSFGANDAPPSPVRSWSPPGLDQYQKELAKGDLTSKQNGAQVGIDPNKIYNLPELIDIAERCNPKTQVAWERARQAASAVGLSQSAYYPYLIASASAGYERAFLPFPTLVQGPGPTDVSISGGGTLASDAVEGGPMLSLKWLLFDFGERKASVAMAKENLMAANVGFNGTHQEIVFTVTQRFYELNTARQKAKVAESAVQAAHTVAQSAQAQLERGLAVKPETLQAEQQSAQAEFDLESARGALSDAQVAFVNSLGILPTTRLQVAEVAESPVLEFSVDTLEDLIEKALSQRPDLVAKLADVRARRAEVQKAHAAYYPKILLSGNVGWKQLDVTMADSPFFGGHEPIYGAKLAIELPLFDGFARRKKLNIAESELRAAEDELMHSRDTAIQEVWKARTDFETALRKQESAAKLVRSAESAYAASLEAYQHGLGTYVSVANAQHSLTAARSVVVDTRSAIFTSQTALALSIGELAKPTSAPKWNRKP